jgi:hypothetical protein
MKILALILALSLSSVAYAENEIVGAFGVRLGDAIDERMEFVEQNDKGALVYKFTPDKRHEYFSEYTVLATIKTKIIFRIIAIHQYANKEACHGRRRILRVALSKKYGKASGLTSFIPVWKNDNRAILLNCKGYPEKGLQLEYLDKDLETRAMEEKADDVKDSL